MLGSLNISDIVAIVIVVLFVMWGAKKGLVKSVLGLGSIIISIVLALTLYQPVSTFLKDSVIGEYVTVNIAKVLDASEKEPEEMETEDAANALNLPPEIMSKVSESVDDIKTTALGSISTSVSSLAINLLSMLIVFLVIKLILWIITLLLDAVTGIPVIRGLNKMLGGVLGAVSGIITIYILLAILTFMTAVDTDNKIVNNVLESTYVSKMYNDNFVVNFINVDK